MNKLPKFILVVWTFFTLNISYLFGSYSLESMPVEIFGNITRHIQNGKDIITLRRLSKEVNRLVKDNLLEEYKFLNEEKYKDNRLYLIDRYLYRITFYNSFSFENQRGNYDKYELKSLANAEFVLMHKVNLLDITSDPIYQDHHQILKEGFSFLKKRIKMSALNNIEEIDLLRTISTSLELIIEEDFINLQYLYLLSKFKYLESRFFENARDSLFRQAKSGMERILSYQNLYQNKAKCFHSKYLCERPKSLFK